MRPLWPAFKNLIREIRGIRGVFFLFLTRTSNCTRICIDGFQAVCSNVLVTPSGRILAVDYGDKNVGLAFSDELGLTVQPLPSLINHGRRDLLKRLKEIVRAMDIQRVILGMPLNMDGTRGDSIIRMERILRVLKNGLNLPLVGFDERLSTVEALDFWRSMTARQQKKYRTADSLAAAFILERYLKEN
jgi:putative holliday junction resolvase